MNIVDDPRKKELYKLLNDMYKCADNNKIKDYYFLKNLYLKLLKEIFLIDIHKQDKDEEGFEWAAASNILDTLFTYYDLYKNKPDKKSECEEIKKKLLATFLERIEKLKNYLT